MCTHVVLRSKLFIPPLSISRCIRSTNIHQYTIAKQKYSNQSCCAKKEINNHGSFGNESLNNQTYDGLYWDINASSYGLSVINDGHKILWDETIENIDEIEWLGSQCLPILHKGIFEWQFEIGPLHNSEMGCGIMLYPPKYGTFGYLGTGSNQWSYDPSSGDIITETESIMNKLPKFENNKGGIIDVKLDLKYSNSFQFIVNGQEIPNVKIKTWSQNYADKLRNTLDYDNDFIDIEHPAVVVAAYLVHRNQWVNIMNFKQIE
eukprot:544257_1